jgi:WhiB family redox-sensing transcriptional regulator
VITQEQQENIIEMSQRGLSASNIAAVVGVEGTAVDILLAQARAAEIIRPPKPKKKAEVKPEVPWVDPENIGVEENWEVDGLCRTSGYPDMWFPKPTEYNLIKLAQRVCYRCPVIMECRTMALARGERNGVWGGLTELQRRRMRKTAQKENAV